MLHDESNATANTACLGAATLGGVHPSAVRLYEAARVLKKTTGQSAVARLLNASPQKVKHWETRGVSLEGCFEAARVLGCCVAWLHEGIGPMLPAASAPPAAHDVKGAYNTLPDLSVALPVVLDAVVQAPEAAKLMAALQALLVDDSPLYRQRIAELLKPRSESGEIAPSRPAPNRTGTAG